MWRFSRFERQYTVYVNGMYVERERDLGYKMATKQDRLWILYFPYVSMPRCIKPRFGMNPCKGKGRESRQGFSSSIDRLCPTRQHLVPVSEADIDLDVPGSTVPFALCQLALIVEFGIRDLALMPTAVLVHAEHGGPKALRVMTRLGVDALHLPQEEILQHLLVKLPRVLVDRLPSDGEDGARLESDRLGGPVATKIVEEVFEVFRRGLDGSLAFEDPLW